MTPTTMHIDTSPASDGIQKLATGSVTADGTSDPNNSENSAHGQIDGDELDVDRDLGETLGDSTTMDGSVLTIDGDAEFDDYEETLEESDILMDESTTAENKSDTNLGSPSPKPPSSLKQTVQASKQHTILHQEADHLTPPYADNPFAEVIANN